MADTTRTEELVREMSNAKPAGESGGSLPNWVPNAELQKLLGCSKSTLQRWRSTKKLPFAKVGQMIFYHIDDVDDLLQNHRR